MAEIVKIDEPTEGIVTDAAHSEKNKVTEYQGRNLQTGEYLFYRNLGHQTVNIGEFLAVVDAVKYIIENNFKPRVIYTDSLTAITWFKNKKASSRKRNKHLQKAEVFLKALSYDVDTIEVKHWNNRIWGENPSDFGRK